MIYPDGRMRCLLCEAPATHSHFRCEDHPVTKDAEELSRVFRVLRRLVAAIKGQIGEDTVEESLEYMHAFADAEALAVSGLKEEALITASGEREESPVDELVELQKAIDINAEAIVRLEMTLARLTRSLCKTSQRNLYHNKEAEKKVANAKVKSRQSK